jgi:hypothetical protein
MRIGGVLDRDSPAVIERILHLQLDLGFREIWQERELTLSDLHFVSS